MHAAKAPTPGTTSPSAANADDQSAVMATSAPTRSSARCAERRLPDPWSRTTTRGRLTAASGRRPRQVGGSRTERRSQRALGARYAAHPRIEGASLAQSPGDRLELRLMDVVGVAAGEDANVQANPSGRGEGLEDMAGQRGVVIPDQGRQTGRLLVHAVRTPGHVDGNLDESLVQRYERVAKTSDAGAITQRGIQRLSKDDRGVLDGVMRVDMQIAIGCDRKIEARVL